MACDQQTPCSPCNPDYTDLGCSDYPWTSCVIYNGENIPCLNISQTENLNDVIQHIKDVVCSLTPGSYASFDYKCFSSQGITTEQQFVEFISTLLCSVLGTQTPTTVTSLSSLYSLIQSLTTNVNLIKNQTLVSCFQTLSGLTTPQQIGDLLTAVQNIICNHETRLDALESGSVNTNITVINANHDVNLTASGTNNHTLSADVKIDPDSLNAITTSVAGVKVLSPDVSVVDTQSVNLTASGSKNHTIQADVKISSTAGNAVSILSDGIYVNPASITETALVANDSSSIDFTQSGVNGHTVTASVILNPSLSNLITSTPSGLLVNASSVQDPISPVDTNTINLTTSGSANHTIQADVIVSPTVNNLLQALSNGLYVDSTAISSNGWLLTGNSSATNSNFIGTTNNVPINFRVNNIKSGRVDSTGQANFGFQSGLSNTSTFISSFGYKALYANTTGTENSAFGHNALVTNTTGYDNAAFGGQALQDNNGNLNAAFGHRSLQLSNADQNTAIGSFAGTLTLTTLTGSKNTFLGALTSYTIGAITGSTAIGYNAIVSESNNMVLGGTGADKVSVVIGATAANPAAVLDVTSTTQGFLPPRMTEAQKAAIVAPVAGLTVYVTDGIAVDASTGVVQTYNGSTWKKHW